MTEREIHALPLKACDDVRPDDHKIGVTEPYWRHDGWCWEEAYERLSTGERFMVQQYDADRYPTDPSWVRRVPKEPICLGWGDDVSSASYSVFCDD